MEKLDDFYEMLNYHYFWRNNFKSSDVFDDFQYSNKILFDDIDYQVCQIILKYSYPSCLSENLTNEEKLSIINNEILIIAEEIMKNSNKINGLYKIKPMDIIIYKIPRILYDLFNLYNQLMKIQTIQQYNLDINNYNLYKNRLFRYYNYSIKSIIELNNFIDKYMEKPLFKNKDGEFDFMKIMLDIIDKIKTIIDNKNDAISNKLMTLNAEMNNGFYSDISNFEYLNNFTSNYDRILEILKETLNLELGITTLNKDKNKFIMYRGADSQIEDITKNDNVHSISYNSSILNGILSDKSACTLLYFKSGSYKQYYILNKHFNDDCSNESLILFIPPVHPYFLLNIKGEYWHIRSKVPRNTIKRISGVHNIFNIKKIPDYLLSDENEQKLGELIKTTIIPNRFEVIPKEYIKYLKYKDKYLNLKKIIIR